MVWIEKKNQRCYNSSDKRNSKMQKQDMLITSLTQVELADKLGVSQPLISKWMSGKCMPRVKTIRKIAQATGCTEEELLMYLYAKNKELARL